MRELKFRIWNKNAKDFVRDGVNRIVCFDLIYFSYYCSVNRLENLNDFIVQQFTCLFDKNNVPIYEGDILKYEYSQADMSSFAALESAFRTCIDYEAKFINGGFVAQPIEYSQYDSPLADCVADLEIIGHIFQNPELLK